MSTFLVVSIYYENRNKETRELVQTALNDATKDTPRSEEFYQRWGLLALMFGIFMAGMDSSIVMISLPKIQASLGASMEELEWVANGYLLAQVVVMPTAGRLSDIFGCRFFYVFGLSLFVLASALCGTAWNPEALIFFRVLQGIGAGVLMTSSLAILSHTFPPAKLGRAMGTWIAGITIAAAAGPTLGGYLTENFGWESIFLVNVPVGIMGVIMTLTILKETRRVKQRVDILGFLTLTVSLTSFLLALIEGHRRGWDSGFIMGLWWLAALFFVIFVACEMITKEPMVDFSLFKNVNFDCICLVSGISTMAMFLSIFLMPLYMEKVLAYSTMRSALAVTPSPLVAVFLSPIVGRLLDRMSPKSLIMIGVASLLISMYYLSRLSQDASYSDIAFPLLAMGAGVAFILVPCVKASQEVLPREKLGIGAGVYNLIRYFSVVVGIALVGVTLEERGAFHMLNYTQHLTPFTIETQQITNKMAGYFTRMGSPSATATHQVYSMLANMLEMEAFMEAQNDVYRLVIFVLLLSLIPLFLIRTPKKSKIAPKP